jgi:hypothetical protein
MTTPVDAPFSLVEYSGLLRWRMAASITELRHRTDVRYWHKADMLNALTMSPFGGKSGQ